MRMTPVRAAIIGTALAAVLACACAVSLALMLSPPSPCRWVIEGRAATTDLDLNDVVFEKSALRRAAERMMDSPIVLFNHDPNRPIGRLLSAHFERGGVWIKAEISRTEPDVWAKIEDNTLVGLSIGVVPLAEETDWDIKHDRPIQRLTRFVIVEVSVVAIPSNQRARIIVHSEERGR